MKYLLILAALALAAPALADAPATVTLASKVDLTTKAGFRDHAAWREARRQCGGGDPFPVAFDAARKAVTFACR